MRKHYKRHYIQYNDLVFEGYDMIEEDDSTVSFKDNPSAYTFRHGSYSPQKTRGMLAEARSVSMTLTFNLKRIPCQYRDYYMRYVLGQLSEQGKLWAVQNNSLVWAYAYLKEYTELTESRYNTIQIDVEFYLPEGVFHKADKLKTFILPYDICDFVECLNLKSVDPCKSFSFTDCCNCMADTKGKKDSCDCCDCSDLTKEMALCYFDDYQAFYDPCRTRYKVVYDCSAAHKLFFSSYYGQTYMGQKFCADCKSIAGILYSDTDIVTGGVKITLHGDMHDPYIEINGNGNIIKGDFEDGALEIHPDGTVYYIPDGCVRCDPLPVNKWVVPKGMYYGWRVHSGNNRVVIESGSCCGTVCAYIEVDALTF